MHVVKQKILTVTAMVHMRSLLTFIVAFAISFATTAQGPGPCVPTLININLDQYPSELLGIFKIL